MKNALIFAGLVALSVLYLLEVDFSSLSWLNVAAFIIIALTLVPLLWKLIAGIVRRVREKRADDEEQERADSNK